eukprot:6462476-Amphidinium_carterae.1
MRGLTRRLPRRGPSTPPSVNSSHSLSEATVSVLELEESAIEPSAFFLSPAVPEVERFSLTVDLALPNEIDASRAREASGSNDPSLMQPNILATSRKAPMH